MSTPQSHCVDIQLNSSFKPQPNTLEIMRFASLALNLKETFQEVTIRLVDKPEIQELNNEFRKQNKPTNVLAFPSQLPSEVQLDVPFLGDIIICTEIVSEEATAQGKLFLNHFAHMVIHGILHLLGYDHINEKDASIMESLEIKLLSQLNIPNPYKEIN